MLSGGQVPFDAIGSEKSEAPDARLSERNCARAAS